MIRVILRRSSSLAPERALAALSSIKNQFLASSAIVEPKVGGFPGEVRPYSFLSSAASKGSSFGIRDGVAKVVDGEVVKGRDFHVKSGPLDFKASSVTSAQFAYSYDEEKGSPASSDEAGLEIAKLPISQEIVTALARKGITKLFPIQKAVLEPAMQGRDLFGRARTGTGKTLAFGIPILDKILKFNAKHGRGRNPLALVMAPTRELARQVEKEFQDSAPSLDTLCVYGGTPIGRQIQALQYGVDVVIGTPGRIIDLMKRGSLNLSEIQFVVLDEADQMLGVGFVDDIETIFPRLPQNRHTMLFSATMPSWIRNLVRNYLKNPLTIDLVGDDDKKLADGITLFSIASDMYGKASILGPLITEHAKGGKCIIFTQTKRDADRLANAIAGKFRCEPLHGDISQSQRERTLSGFRNGHFNILVATDVAARGLDVPNVDLIVHYELPNTSETFVHRSGRTGRAGKKGTAILIHTDGQRRQVQMIERDVGCKFTELPRITVEGEDLIRLDNRFSPNGGDRGFGDRGFRDRGFGNKSFRDGGFGDRGFRDRGFSRPGGFGDYGLGRRDGSRNSEFSRSNSHGGGHFSDQSNAFGNFGDLGSGRPSRFGSFGDPQRR